VYFEKIFQDNRDRLLHFSFSLLSGLWIQFDAEPLIATTSRRNPQYQPGFPADHPSGFSNNDAQGHGNKLPNPGSHSLERVGGGDHRR
jgi:hypothetical protein